MIFAAGLGTRLKPWTDAHPKALAQVNGKALLQRNIEYLKSFGVQEFIINVHHFAEQVMDFLTLHNNFNCGITISHEKEEPLETGGGLKKAGWFFEEDRPFIVMNADILTDLDLNQMQVFHSRHQSLATVAVTNRVTSRNFLLNAESRLCGWQNNATGEQRIALLMPNLVPRAFSGIHIMNPDIFPVLTEEGKFSLVDAYLRLAISYPIFGFDHSGDKFVDVGKPESITKAEALFA